GATVRPTEAARTHIAAWYRVPGTAGAHVVGPVPDTAATFTGPTAVVVTARAPLPSYTGWGTGATAALVPAHPPMPPSKVALTPDSRFVTGSSADALDDGITVAAATATSRASPSPQLFRTDSSFPPQSSAARTLPARSRRGVSA